MTADPMSVDAARQRLTVPTGADPLVAARKSVAAVGSASSSSSHAQYLARLTDFRQMDIQSALDQMKTLLSTRAQVVYKTAYYRKQTKNHWARDDPAFAALQLIFLVISCIAYSISFRVPFTGGLAFVLYSVVFNWLGVGFVVASAAREIANRHLTDHKSSSHVRQSVEWLYAFDIHCNAFFPVFVLLCKWVLDPSLFGHIYVRGFTTRKFYFANSMLGITRRCPRFLSVSVSSRQFMRRIDGLQFFLLPLVLGKSLLAFLVSNTLYAASFAWYWYITHLGYRALPFLSQTEVFLFPVAAIVLVYALNLIGYPFGLGWNASRVMAHIYFD